MIPRLIINADDWSMSPLFNKGILELIEKRIITSTTVMINRKFTDPEKLLAHKSISIGLHLEIPSKTTLKEIDLQIKKFKALFKQLPSHLDGHQHHHLTENNLSLVLKTARKYNLFVRSHFSPDRKMIRKAGIKSPDTFISWHPKRYAKFFQKIKSARGKIIEIVCHPGYYDKNCDYPYNKQREEELKILKSLEFKKAISGYELINYNDL